MKTTWTLLLNSVIGFLADWALRITVLIAIYMVSTQLGHLTIGLYVIRTVADYLMMKEYNELMNESTNNILKMIKGNDNENE